MYKLVISDDDGKTTVVPLVRDEISVGRKEGNTIRLTERNVSREHAKLLKANGAFHVHDLGSYNGVRVNGQRIDGSAVLKAGDQVLIGDYLLAVQLDEPDADSAGTDGAAGQADAATAMLAAPEEPQTPARLVMLSPPAPGAEFALSRPSTRIGRAEDLDAWINHRSISREHAEVSRDGDEFRIVDLGSANGVRVNGSDVTESPLYPGDTVELGQVRFRFVGVGEDYVFDPHSTVQLEAVPVQAGGRAPWVAALGIIGLAVVAAVVLASTEDSGQDKSTATQLPMETSNTSQTQLPAPSKASDDAAFGQALSDCRSALEAGNVAEAASYGAAALELRPSDRAAKDCKDEAEVILQDQGTFEKGQKALAAGDVDTAYFAFEELPPDSALRERPEVSEAELQFAQKHVAEARALLRNEPEEAIRHAGMVLTMSKIPPRARREAENVQKIARRGIARMSTRNRQPRRPTTNTDSNNQTTTTAPAENAVTKCLAQGGANYSRCIVQNLESRARSANELAQLIEAHRQLGNTPAALRHMASFVRRFPSARQANHYRQILARHGE